MATPLKAPLVALALLLVASADVSVQAREEEPRNCEESSSTGGCALFGVSIVELLANPAQYDEKRVRLLGYIHFEFEGNGIYLHQEDAQHHLYKNGFWVSLGKNVSAPGCQDAYVLIEGTFSMRNTGHMGLWSGAVTEITRCIKW